MQVRGGVTNEQHRRFSGRVIIQAPRDASIAEMTEGPCDKIFDACLMMKPGQRYEIERKNRRGFNVQFGDDILLEINGAIAGDW